MAKTVQLSEEAYRRLTTLKQGKESFSDVVNRLAASLKDLRELDSLPPADPDVDLDALNRASREIDLKQAQMIVGAKLKREQADP